MARHLGATAIFKEPILPSPSLAADDFVEFEDLEAQPRSSEDVPNLRIFDARTEAKLRRKRAEREKWLDETYMNFVHGGLDVDAGTCLVLCQNILVESHTRISPFSIDCESANLNISSTSSLETSMTRLIDPPPPSPASTHAMSVSPRPQIEVPKLMKSLRELKLVESPRSPPPESESKKRVGEVEEAGQPVLRAKTASGSKSVVQMLHLVRGVFLVGHFYCARFFIIPCYLSPRRWRWKRDQDCKDAEAELQHFWKR